MGIRTCSRVDQLPHGHGTKGFTVTVNSSRPASSTICTVPKASSGHSLACSAMKSSHFTVTINWTPPWTLFSTQLWSLLISLSQVTEHSLYLSVLLHFSQFSNSTPSEDLHVYKPPGIALNSENWKFWVRASIHKTCIKMSWPFQIQSPSDAWGIKFNDMQKTSTF